jgi:phosphatidylinositol dimannoside acyltransferase
VKDLAGYFLVRVGVGLVGLLPARAARRLGELAGLIWYLFGGDRKRMARRHMQRVQGSNSNLGKRTRAVFRSYGRYWAETLWVRPRRISELDAGLEIVGLEHLKDAAHGGKGAVIALPHVGNWEAAALSGQRAGIEVLAVAEKLANQRLTKWFTSLRKQYGITIVLAGRTSMRGIEDGIARGAAVALLCDRNLSGRGVKTEFFGEVTTLPAGPAALALRTGAPLLIAAAYFTPNGHHLVLQPLELPPGERDLGEVTRHIAKGLEQLIRRAPEQWHLLQPNWPSDQVEA